MSSQVEDVRYLVQVIWAGSSALSSSSDLYSLVLVRWDWRSSWSPWNCILLSKQEAAAHMELRDLQQVCAHGFSTKHPQSAVERL